MEGIMAGVFTELFDWLYVTFAGQRIAILGPRTSGKTSLYNFIVNDDVEIGAPRQAMPGPNQRSHVRNRDLGLAIKKGSDVPGGVREVWEPIFVEANVVFYLFDVVKLQDDPDYEREVNQDGRLMQQWGVNDKKLTLIGTHADQDSRRDQYGSFGEYTDMLSDLDPVVRLTGRLSGGAGRSDVVRVFGSLDSTKNAHEVMQTARNYWR